MVEDKYIGLTLAVSGSLLIGSSFVITKKGLNDAGSGERGAYETAASDNLSYLRNPIWWAGISTMVIGEVANFAAYTFAPPILITPLGALSVIIGAILASFFLNEELRHLGRLGCTLCLIGSLIIVLHAPEDKPVTTVDEILHYAIQPGFLLYCFTVIVFTLVMIYLVAPQHGRRTPTVYLSICSVVGSITVMAAKGFGVAVKLTLGGNNQLTHPSTYVFALVLVVCICIQMDYFNKALDTFSTNIVNPMYYVGFSSATIVASLILFQGFNTTGGTNTVSLLAGFIVTFLGVHLLDVSRQQQQQPSGVLPQHLNGHAHGALDSGLMHPRLSHQGRASIDGWAGRRPSAEATPRAMLHTRRGGPTHGRTPSSSLGQQLFGGYEQPGSDVDGEAVGLQDLREVDVDDSDSDADVDEADERTLLHKAPSGQDRFRQGRTASLPSHALPPSHPT